MNDGCEEWPENSSVCRGWGRVVSRGLIPAGPKRRLTLSFNPALKEDISMAQLQWKLGFVCIWTFPQPAASFGSSRVKFPCLFLSFNYFTFSLEKLKRFPHAVWNRSDRFFSKPVTCPRKRAQREQPFPSLPWPALLLQRMLFLGRRDGGNWWLPLRAPQSLPGRLACARRGSRL